MLGGAVSQHMTREVSEQVGRNVANLIRTGVGKATDRQAPARTWAPLDELSDLLSPHGFRVEWVEHVHGWVLEVTSAGGVEARLWDRPGSRGAILASEFFIQDLRGALRTAPQDVGRVA